MDCSKRICIKNLPENCTKREIAEMIRNRTGAQPHSIDLGVDAEGNTRRYAHFSCEGVKNVLEALSAGCSLRGNAIQAMPAKIHYSFRYAQARQKREREEENEKMERETFWENFRRRLEEKGHNGEISPAPKRLRSFYYEKQKYAAVASEIAAKFRAAHQAQHPSSRPPWAAVPRESNQMKEPSLAQSSPSSASVAVGAPSSPTAEVRPPQTKGKSRGPPSKAQAGSPKPTAESTIPHNPPEPQEPSKAERKLTGLQAKLALLKQKLKK